MHRLLSLCDFLSKISRRQKRGPFSVSKNRTSCDTKTLVKTSPCLFASSKLFDSLKRDVGAEPFDETLSMCFRSSSNASFSAQKKAIFFLSDCDSDTLRVTPTSDLIQRRPVSASSIEVHRTSSGSRTRSESLNFEVQKTANSCQFPSVPETTAVSRAAQMSCLSKMRN